MRGRMQLASYVPGRQVANERMQQLTKAPLVKHHERPPLPERSDLR